MSEKRRAEGDRLGSIERVLDEMRMASAAHTQTDVDEHDRRRTEGDRPGSIKKVSDESKIARVAPAQIDVDEPKKEEQEPVQRAVGDDVRSSEPDGNVEVAPKADEKNSTFTFKATFGERQPAAPSYASTTYN
jgi:hypothetical protein